MSLKCKTDVNVKQIGKGAYGTVYLLSDNTVVKVATDAKEERSKHLILWNSLPQLCKKYFVKPLNLPKNCRSTIPKYSLHAMEYVHGVNMHDYIKYNLSIGNKKDIKLATDALKDAIMCLWRSGFIHMDLHLRNVLVTRNGIKIIDFGMSEKVTPLKTPRKKKDIEKWFSEKYIKKLNKLGFDATNPNLYAYGIKKHKMFYKPNQVLFNKMHKVKSSIK